MSRAEISSDLVAANRAPAPLPPEATPSLERLTVVTSVANLRQAPSHASELVSQLVLGETARVLEAHDGWLRVAGEDGYPGWVDAGAVGRGIGEGRGETLVWGRRSGVVRQGPDAQAIPLCDLVLGARAGVPADAPHAIGDRRQVVLPDGERGWAEAEGWIAQADLPRAFPRSPRALVETALSLRGIPYLWGGNSTKAFDCSGFVQRVFGLHGVPLPRDAWQQGETGAPVAPGEQGARLAPADLLFFAEGGRRVTHVAIALGEEGRVVHGSTHRARVGVAGLDPSDPLYAVSLASTLVGVRRFF
jgi:cell wall-associated NlpC family hydrolase